VLRVLPQLGDRVRRGQPVAEVYSPELAEARTRYVTVTAMLEAHDLELQRTSKLVEIGAASRQELERLHAEHAAQAAEVESARSRLELLGADTSGATAGATIRVPAPIDGIVTERLANTGLNVDPTTKMFTIVDLSNVWVIADVYERDLHRVREGDRATVATKADPDVALEGRVTYIEPQLNVDTRTAKVRVEVANPRGDLRLGMYADVTIAAVRTASGLAVPTAAIQNVGDRHVVYLQVPGDDTKFVEREVSTGRTSGELVEVLTGLTAGDAVVSSGSFFVRAEAERLGLRGSPTQESPGPQTTDHSSHVVQDPQAVRIAVTEKGFEPAKVRLHAGTPARLTFLRTTDNTCATEVVFPSLNIKRALPLNEPVPIEFTPSKAGDVAFVCGMNMLKGVVVVE
jgi:RND family efflux transporter MFP subunit